MPLTENEAGTTGNQPNPRHRRRGCGWLFFLIVVSAVVLTVVMSGRPSTQAFDFLANDEPFKAREALLPFTPSHPTYIQTNIYRIPKPYQELAAKVKNELVAKGYTRSIEGDSQMVMSKTSIRTHVVVTTEGTNTLIHVTAIRDATLIDRARMWIKDRVSPKETASERRIKAMTESP